MRTYIESCRLQMTRSCRMHKHFILAVNGTVYASLGYPSRITSFMLACGGIAQLGEVSSMRR